MGKINELKKHYESQLLDVTEVLDVIEDKQKKIDYAIEAQRIFANELEFITMKINYNIGYLNHCVEYFKL